MVELDARRDPEELGRELGLFGVVSEPLEHDLDKRALGSFTLTDPLDSALVDDARCYHGVTPVEPENPAQPAYRDVLVVTFRKKA